MLLMLSGAASTADSLKPFVSYGHYYDSNIFRVDRDEAVVIEENGTVKTAPQRSDRYSVLSAGLNLDWRPGRQRVIASLARSQVRFDRYAFLDYDGEDYLVTWQWRLGNDWSGRIGASRKVSQASFADFSNAAAVNNRLERDSVFGSAEWQIGSRWSAGLDGSRLRTANSAPLYAAQDYTETGIASWLGYATPKGSRLRGQLRTTRARYPKRATLPGMLVDNSFAQTELGFLGDWDISAKVKSHMTMAYIKRDHDNVVQRDFSGISTRTWIDYGASAKTGFSAAVYRELGSSELENARYFLNSGVSLGASWKLTDKLVLRAAGTAERHDYKGDPAPVAGVASRSDKLVSGMLSLSYAPTQAVSIDLGAQSARRDTNQIGEDYVSHQLFTTVRVDF